MWNISPTHINDLLNSTFITPANYMMKYPLKYAATGIAYEHITENLNSQR